MREKVIYIILGFLIITGCTETPSEPEIENEVPDFVVGEINSEVTQVLEDEPIEYPLTKVNETDELIHSNTMLDISENQTNDIDFSVWLFKEDGRQLVTIKSEADAEIAFVIDKTEENRFGLFEGGDFRVPKLAEYGNVIEENKVLNFYSDGSVAKSDSLIWIKNEYLFAAEIILNQSYTPSGIKTFTTESNYLLFYLEGKEGWIDFEFTFNGSATSISGIKVNRIVIRKE